MEETPGKARLEGSLSQDGKTDVAKIDVTCTEQTIKNQIMKTKLEIHVDYKTYKMEHKEMEHKFYSRDIEFLSFKNEYKLEAAHWHKAVRV